MRVILELAMKIPAVIAKIPKKYFVWAFALAGSLAAGVVLLGVVSYALIAPSGKYVYAVDDKRQIVTANAPVAIVLGAGITKDGKPYKELQGRLDVAAEAFRVGYVRKIIVSGDNRSHGYNEPDAMRTYLVNEKGIAAKYIQPDYAGRSTYETCERAAKVFGLKKAMIVSTRSHLPRAIYLCRHFGVESYGIAGGAEANNSWRREPLARVKAVINIYIWGEKTILGPRIKI